MVQNALRIYLTGTNGHDIAALVREQSSHAFLFLHGFPDSKEIWLPVLNSLEQHESFVAVDLPTFGESSLVASDADMALDELTKSIFHSLGTLPFKTYTLVAHDWGAMIAWNLMERSPGHFRALILANGPHPAVYHRSLKIPAQSEIFKYVNYFCQPQADKMLLKDSVRILKMHRHFQPGLGHIHDEAEFERMWRRAGQLRSALGIYRANYLNILNGRVCMHQTSSPVYVFWGENDHSLVAEQSTGLREFVTGHLEIHKVTGGHWSFLEHPEKFTSILISESERSDD